MDLALVARSLAPEGSTSVPAAWYTPIEQQVILLEKGKNKAAAQAFFAYLASDPALALMDTSGYGRCPWLNPNSRPSG